MIATLTEIKALLAMTSTAQDDLLNRMIPIVEDDIRHYCNNGFRDENIYIQTGDISFTHNSTSADTINLDAGSDGFDDALFKAGQTVQVQGSYNNNGFFEVETVTSAVMTLYSSTSRPYYDPLVTEDESVLVKITKVEYPKAIKLIESQMLKYKLSNYDYSVAAETVARYSVTFNQNMRSGYPESIMSGLNRWRRPVFA